MFLSSYIAKHLPGRHDQQRHGVKTALGSDATVESLETLSDTEAEEAANEILRAFPADEYKTRHFALSALDDTRPGSIVGASGLLLRDTGGNLVGITSYMEYDAREEIYLGNLVAKKGYGLTLLRQVAQKALDKKYRIELYSMASAKPFYQSVGMHPIFEDTPTNDLVWELPDIQKFAEDYDKKQSYRLGLQKSFADGVCVVKHQPGRHNQKKHAGPSAPEPHSQPISEFENCIEGKVVEESPPISGISLYEVTSVLDADLAVTALDLGEGLIHNEPATKLAYDVDKDKLYITSNGLHSEIQNTIPNGASHRFVMFTYEEGSFVFCTDPWRSGISSSDDENEESYLNDPKEVLAQIRYTKRAVDSIYKCVDKIMSLGFDGNRMGMTVVSPYTFSGYSAIIEKPYLESPIEKHQPGRHDQLRHGRVHTLEGQTNLLEYNARGLFTPISSEDLIGVNNYLKRSMVPNPKFAGKKDGYVRLFHETRKDYVSSILNKGLEVRIPGPYTVNTGVWFVDEGAFAISEGGAVVFPNEDAVIVAWAPKDNLVIDEQGTMSNYPISPEDIEGVAYGNEGWDMEIKHLPGKHNQQHHAGQHFTTSRGTEYMTDTLDTKAAWHKVRDEVEDWEGARKDVALDAMDDLYSHIIYGSDPSPLSKSGWVLRDPTTKETLGIVSYKVEEYDNLYVRNLATKRTGYGPIIMKKIAQEAVENYAGVSLESSNDDASRFYDALGMRRTSEVSEEGGYPVYQWTFREAARFANYQGA